MIRGIKQHLEDSQCSYIEHFKFAVVASGRLLWASMTSLIHAFIPSIFKGSAAWVVIDLYKNRLENHPNSTYQDWIKNGTDKSGSN